MKTRQRSFPEFVTYCVRIAVLVLLVGGLSVLWLSGKDDLPSLQVEYRLEDAEQRTDAY